MAHSKYHFPRLELLVVREGPETPIPANGPGACLDIAERLLNGKDREHFLAIHLDAKHNMTGYEVVSVGTLNSSLVHPREVFKSAILSNSVGIVCVHNHPSGDPAPSSEDKAVCRRLLDSGKLLGIPLVDFLIVASGGSFSGRANWDIFRQPT